MKKKILIILSILWTFLINYNTFATGGDTYNMYSLPNSSINTSSGYTLVLWHIDGDFYINDKFLDIFLVKFFLTFLWLTFFLLISLKAFNLWKK